MIINNPSNKNSNIMLDSNTLVKRYERKFEISYWKTNSLKGFLISKGFKKQFPNRIVNSLYYEDKFLSCFSTAMNGENLRYKIRLRFYNEGDNGYQIEKKIKQDDKNWKKIYSQNSHSLGGLLPIVDNSKRILFKISHIPKNIEVIYNPISFVSYKREYYVSKDSNLRITIDKNVNFLQAKLDNEKIHLLRYRKLNHNILEAKYNQNYDMDFSLIDEISNKLNLILSKSSKYCKSISYLYNY